MRRLIRDERGAVAAEHVAAIVIVAALIAAVWSVAFPQRVEEAAELAVDCLFQSDPERCDLDSLAVEGDGSTATDPDEDDELAQLQEALERLPEGTQIIDEETGEVLWTTGDELTGDPELDEILRMLAAISDHLADVVGRDSFDGAGHPLIVWLNADTPNAAWLGRSGQLETVYATGWELPGVIAHEFGHALVMFTIDLGLDPQERALNESLSDMFAYNITGEWPLEGPNGVVRDMSDPTSLGNPAHVDDYDPADGRHHFNSTITSHAYYHMVDGVGGLGRESAEEILYLAMIDHIRPSLDSGAGALEAFRDGMLDAAAALHGTDSDEYRSVQEALDEVGLDEDFDGV